MFPKPLATSRHLLGALTIPISGTSTAGVDYGQLSATGAATLGGTLTLAPASGYVPPIGTSYTILEAASISGTFATVNGAQMANRQEPDGVHRRLKASSNEARELARASCSAALRLLGPQLLGQRLGVSEQTISLTQIPRLAHHALARHGKLGPQTLEL
jgi:hypothetical protein